MRTLSAGATAGIGDRIALTILVEMSLTAPLRVAFCRDDIDWDGKTFIGGKQSALDPIKDQGGEVAGMSFTLSGVPTEYISLALAEPIQGKIVKVWTALMSADTLAIFDVLPLWAGTLDQMPISQGPETSTITVTAEHRGITFARPKGLRYTSADQMRLYPGDRSLDYVVANSQHADIWPAASFFTRK